jgi:DNA repair protein RecN (Recombination protein N)
MLTTLRIRNLALVDDLTLELGPGYNVITGETGAGKSILIGALTLVLGERADRTFIRSGSDSCTVEALFDVSRLRAPLSGLLETNGLESCEDSQLVLKRVFTAAGSNRQFVNGTPTTLNVLAEIGQWLVDIHGPHDHQSLLNPSRQLSILDAYGDLGGAREEFGELVRRHAALEAEKSALIVDEKSYVQQMDLLRFQCNEISAAHLQSGEDQQIEREYLRASNSSRLLQLSQAAQGLLNDSETSLLTQSGELGRALQEMQRMDSSTDELLRMHQEAASLLRELEQAISHYAERVELDPSRLQQLEERLNLLHSLKRKYGPSLSEVMAFAAQARSKLTTMEQRDVQLARLNEDQKKLRAELLTAGKALSARRRKLVQPLTKAISRQLGDLGFKQSRFDISMNTLDPAPLKEQPARGTLHGLDSVDFQFAPNPGEPIRPLRAIASSGELARVMLALKTVLAAEDQIPVLVFDEVDANVGGETAHAVGEKMRQIAQNRQVLCITHLPQVAAPASAHFLALKEVRAGRTVSQIMPLEKAQRITELARMFGGQTDAARKHAEALLKKA